MTNPTPAARDDLRATLTALYRAALDAVAPGPALARALDVEPDVDPRRRVWVLALGKAAHPMAAAAVAALRSRGAEPAGGLVVAPEPAPPPHPALEVAVGDHPEPGPRSLNAAARLARVTERVRPDDEAWVCISGGATSLIAAPVPGVSADDLARLYRLLLGSGLDIHAMNAVRKRVSRWGAGRLAAALAPARVRAFLLSDVPGDDPATIASGPCTPDNTRAAEIRALLTSAALWTRLPKSVRNAIAAAETDPSLETPKPHHPAFRRVTTRVIASNRTALEAAATRARALGLATTLAPEPLHGEAADAGRRVAATLLHNSQAAAAQRSGGVSICVMWGGETVVTLGSGPVGRGGRCQELALAAADVLWRAGDVGRRVWLLAAGTDGRDGPTDAAGAVVSGETWGRILEAGLDPADALRRHDAYPVLDAAGALLRTGLTGTNVMDVAIGLVASEGP